MSCYVSLLFCVLPLLVVFGRQLRPSLAMRPMELCQFPICYLNKRTLLHVKLAWLGFVVSACPPASFVGPQHPLHFPKAGRLVYNFQVSPLSLYWSRYLILFVGGSQFLVFAMRQPCCPNVLFPLNKFMGFGFFSFQL